MPEQPVHLLEFLLRTTSPNASRCSLQSTDPRSAPGTSMQIFCAAFQVPAAVRSFIPRRTPGPAAVLANETR